MALLELEDVNTYYDKLHVLRDVSMKVEDGQIVAMLGQNGTGKTTIMRSIMGLVMPESGTIRYRGEEIQDLRPTETSRLGISFIPGERRLFNRQSVRKNLRMGYIGHNLDETFEKRLEDVFEYFPVLEERQDQRTADLSGGERQMVALSRALISDPEMLLLDEPTEGLMPSIVDDLERIIRRINDDGITILLVEHDVQLAFDLSDYTYLLDSGSFQAEGPSNLIRENQEVMEKYLMI